MKYDAQRIECQNSVIWWRGLLIIWPRVILCIITFVIGVVIYMQGLQTDSEHQKNLYILYFVYGLHTLTLNPSSRSDLAQLICRCQSCSTNYSPFVIIRFSVFVHSG